MPTPGNRGLKAHFDGSEVLIHNFVDPPSVVARREVASEMDPGISRYISVYPGSFFCSPACGARTPPLPHVDGMLAVSDKTFARLAAMVEPAVRSALVAVNLKHAGWFDTPDTTAERQVAEDAYPRRGHRQGACAVKEAARRHVAAWRCRDARATDAARSHERHGAATREPRVRTRHKGVPRGRAFGHAPAPAAGAAEKPRPRAGANTWTRLRPRLRAEPLAAGNTEAALRNCDPITTKQGCSTFSDLNVTPFDLYRDRLNFHSSSSTRASRS